MIPTLRDNRARLADLRRQLADLSVTLTPANYKIQQLNAQIADLEQQSTQHRNNIIRRLGVQNSETARRKDFLTKAYQAQLGVVSDQSSKEVRYNILKKEVDVNRDIYQSMSHAGERSEHRRSSEVERRARGQSRDSRLNRPTARVCL